MNAAAARKTVAKKARAKKTKEKASIDGQWWELRLYVAGHTPLSVAAFANLQKICEEHLKGRYRIEVIDLLVNRRWRAATRSSPCPRWCASCLRR